MATIPTNGIPPLAGLASYEEAARPGYGVDDNVDGKVDEGFLGSSPACPASSCGEIAATSGFGPGDYFSRDTPSLPLTCYF